MTSPTFSVIATHDPRKPEIAGDTTHHLINVVVQVSADPWPVREFDQLMGFHLDEAHATELLGELAIALAQIRAARKSEGVVQ